MRAYTGVREYSVENKRFKVRAGMKVEVTATAAGSKTFRIISVNGPGAVRKLVFNRMLETEERASTPEGQAQTRICRQNYDFKFVETAMADGRQHYVLEAAPKSDNPLLFQGRIWIDAGAMAIAKIEAKPAKKPSFWVTRTSFIHQYSLVDGHWVPALNRSDSAIRIFGHSTTRIVYSDYSFTKPAGEQ